jgi:hypothetical protein
MSKGISQPPRYRLQKEKSRPDRDYVVISDRRIWLGTYGLPESYKRYAEAIREKRVTCVQPLAPKPAPSAPTIIMLIADYLKFAIRKYG